MCNLHASAYLQFQWFADKYTIVATLHTISNKSKLQTISFLTFLRKETVTGKLQKYPLKPAGKLKRNQTNEWPS